MDQEKKQSYCNIHPNFYNNLLLFEENNIHTKICSVCAKKLAKKFNKVIDHAEFLYADQNYIFSSFPPLEDEDIYDTIQNLQIKRDSSIQKILIEKINNYFITLKKEVNQKIDLLQNEVKSKIIKIEDFNQNQGNNFLNIYNEISSKFDIQKLYNEYSKNSDQRIKEIIQEKYQNIKSNTEKLQKYLSEYQAIINIINLKTPIEIQQKILDLLDQIDFFNIKDIENLEFEKSKSYASSQSLQIQRLQNKQIQINQSNDCNYGVSYANFILDPYKKYIFRVRLQTNSQSNSFLIVGIIQEQDKDKKQLYDGICYKERGDHKIKKIIKGNNVFEGSKTNIDKEIEIRIHLAQKMIKIANYPNYENVAELENNQLILDNTEYRLAVELYYSVHKIIITHLSTVAEFDKNM